VNTTQAQQRAPEVYPLPRVISGLCSCPEHSSAAVCGEESGIELLRFSEGELSVEQIRLDGLSGDALGVSGMHCFAPAQNRFFGFAEKRAAVFIDLQQRAGLWLRICPRLEETMRGAYLIDDESASVVFDVRVVTEPGNTRRLLRAVPFRRLTSPIADDVELAAPASGYSEPLCTIMGAVFLYRQRSHELTILNTSLLPVAHSLAALFADKKERLRLLTDIAVHPTLPFALLVDRSPVRNERYVVHLAMWDIDEPKIVPVPMPGVNREGLYCSGFAFSPDGRWVVYRDETEDDLDPVFMAMPVALDKPPYLGAPVTLGKTYAGPPSSTCWSTGPTSFVATDGSALYRWVLE
jgi:hypothetical protein